MACSIVARKNGQENVATSIFRSSNDTLNRSRPGVFLFFLLSLSLYLSISSLIYSRRNITNETIFPSREQRRMIDGSRKEISGFQIFRIEKISRRNVSTFVRHKNGECKRRKLFYIYRKSVWPRVKVVHVIHMASTLLFVKHWFTFSKVFPFRPSMASKIERNLWGNVFAIRSTFVKYRFLK